MGIKTISNQSTWQKFFDASHSPSFLQSWEWGEFEKKMGFEILRLGLYEKTKLQAIALVIKIRARRGDFLFIPHGPIFSSISNIKHQRSKIKTYLRSLQKHLINLAKKEGFVFIRIGPTLENTLENQKLFADLGFIKAPIYIHSENFWLLPLEKTEDELLSGMRKTTRYLIRKAIRDGVIIEKTNKASCLKDFFAIYKETARREQFSPYSNEYIKQEFEAFAKTRNALFLFGKINDNETQTRQKQIFHFREPRFDEGDSRVKNLRCRVPNYLASALVLFTKTGAFYHQGASIHTKIPVPYLLQWEAIREAKKRGCRFYNFWGIHIAGRTPKAWEGLTLFKTGFGGYEYKCLPTQDYIISPKYWFTYLYEKFLLWKRG